MARPTTGINQCGHNEDRHFAKSMCKICYYKDRNSRIKVDPILKERRKLAVNKNHLRTDRRREKWTTKKFDPDLCETILKKAKGLCEICGKRTGRTRAGAFKKLHLDHNHKINKPRGALCQACNVAIGLFKDNVIVMARAIEYIKIDGAQHAN